jgi:glyoxylase-like metal-dependent hydrolase (beta-lactamase superfamily II)
LISLAGVLGIVLFLGGGILAKVYMESRKLSPVETREIAPGVYAVKDSYVNLFLMKNNDTYIAFDAGNNEKQVLEELLKLKIDPKTVVAVFLTHSDVDHIAALALFENAVIYLPKTEEPMANGQISRFLFMKNQLAHPHELVEDNQILTISGLEIKGISTPGHTPGSMSFLVNETHLFTGDTMGIKNGEVTQFNDLFNMDTRCQRKSITRLAALPGVDYIFTAHYGIIDSPETAFRNWKE